MPENISGKKLSRPRLLEIAIVMITIVFLFAIAFSLVIINQAQNRDIERISEVNDLRAALQSYYLDKGYYPVEASWCSVESNCQNLLKEIPPYLSVLPQDPLYPANDEEKLYSYRYKTTEDGKEYKIYAELERKEFYELGSKGSFILSYPE